MTWNPEMDWWISWLGVQPTIRKRASCSVGPELRVTGDFDPSADFQAAKLINKRVMINVEKNVSGNGGEFNKIVDIMAVPRGKVSSTAATPDPDLAIQTQTGASTQPKQLVPPEPPAPPDDTIPW